MATLPPLPQPVSSPADYATQLEILSKIEDLGGSVGYERNQGAVLSDPRLVAALDPYDSEVWARAIEELAKHEGDSDAQALRAQLQEEVDLQNANPELAQKQRISEIIRGIESLGGSAGLQKYTEHARPAMLRSDSHKHTARLRGWSNSAYAWGFVASSFFVTTMTLNAAGRNGSGYSWGPALGVGTLQGVLYYDSFKADDFYFVNAAGVATATFQSGSTDTSEFDGLLVGVSVALSFGGSWSW